MSSTFEANSRPSRLNPFAFPSDTDFRFILLIFSVIGSTLLIYNVLSAKSLFSQITITLLCRASTQVHASSDIENFLIAQQRIMQCQVPYLHSLIIWLIAGVALVLIVAFIIYWAIPFWKLWREDLEPISVQDAPEVVAYLEELFHESGLAHPPLFVWNPLKQTNGALAFGHFRQYYVTLSSGLVTQFYTDQPAFRAIILHELSHLRNADVNKTYFAVTIWWAFVLVALLPFALYLLIFHPYSTLITFNLVWRVLALAMLVYLTRNAVLRAREFYADVRASTWNGVSEVLSRILVDLSHSSTEHSHAREYWQSLISVHPSSSERNRVLNNTLSLFRVGYWETLGVGIAIGVALPNVRDFLGWLFYLQQVDFRVIFMPDLLGTVVIFTSLIMGTVGLNIWRAAFAAYMQGTSPQGAGRAGLYLGLGIILGTFVSLPTFFEGSSATIVLKQFVYSLPWIVLLLIGLFCFFRWIAAGALIWLDIAATNHALRRIYITGLVIAGVILAVWLTQLFQLGITSSFFLPYSSSLTVAIVTNLFFDVLLQPVTLLASIGLWAFPLAIWFWRNQMKASTRLSWAFIDIPVQQLPPSPQKRLRPGLAVLAGLIGGLTFCILLLIVRLVLHLSSLREIVNNNINLVEDFFYGQIILAVILQACTAGVVTGMVGKLGSLHGLFAAFIGGCIMAIGLLVLNLLFGGTIDFELTQLTSGYIVNGGALLALLVAAGISLLVGLKSQSKLQVRPREAKRAP